MNSLSKGWFGVVAGVVAAGTVAGGCSFGVDDASADNLSPPVEALVTQQDAGTAANTGTRDAALEAQAPKPQIPTDASADASPDAKDASTCVEGTACQLNACALGTTTCDGAGRTVCQPRNFAAAGTTCPTGACDGAGACRAWGGAFETSDPGAPLCHDANRLTSACSCPTGFTATKLRTINDSAAAQWGAIINVCGAAAAGDYAGVFEQDDPAPGNKGCRAKNPYTNDCSCPAGTTAIYLRTLVDVAPGGIIGSKIGLCAKPGGTTFGGAYEKDDPVANGAGCRTPNPATNACSCPPGMTGQNVRVEVDASGGGFIGSTITFCSP